MKIRKANPGASFDDAEGNAAGVANAAQVDAHRHLRMLHKVARRGCQTTDRGRGGEHKVSVETSVDQSLQK